MQELYPGQLLCSKLCHDLITPVGATLSGLELLEENQDGTAHQEIIDLIRLSSTECSRRLTLLRFCFGAGASSSVTCLNDIESTLKKSLDFAKYSYQLDLLDNYLAGHTHLKTWAQILANIFSIGIESMPYGGEINISSQNSDDPQIKIVLKSRLITLHDEVKLILQNGTELDELNPRTIQAYLVWTLSQKLEKHIKLIQKDGEAEILIH